MADRRIFRLGQSGDGSNLLGPNQGSTTPDIFRGEQKPDNSDIFRLTAAGGGSRIFEGGPVLSVFGRVGAVVAVPGDYRANQVTNAVDQTQFYADPGWITSLAWAKVTGAPASFPPAPHTHDASQTVSGLFNTARLGSGAADASVYLRGDGTWAPVAGGVTSVFTRTGAVVALAGDYTASMVTNAVSTLGSYADPAWLTSLAWAKVTGTPASFPPSVHTHDAAAIVTGQFNTARLGSGTANATVYLRGDGAWAAVAGGVASVFTRTGAVVATAGDYTAAQVTNAVDATGSYANPAWITSLAWTKITGAPAAGVSSVFGRVGAVVAANGDYTVSQVTGAVATTRVLTAGAGLSGGGDLSADRTFAVVDDSSTQRNRFSRDAAFVAARRELNVVTGANVTLTMADDAPNNRVNLTIAAAAGGSGGMTDPTTTLGDLIVRGASAPLRLGVGTNGQVLTADSAAGLGVKWGAAPVTSVFTRSGAVVAAAGDYTAAQVTNAVSTLGSYADPAWITSLAWAKITGAPAIFADPLTTKGDLMVRGASTTTRLPVGSNGQVLAADSTQALGVKWAADVLQTPWTSDINGGGFKLANVSRIGVGTAAPGVPIMAVNMSAAIGGIMRFDKDATPTIAWAVGFNDATAALTSDLQLVRYTGAGWLAGLTLQTATGNVGIGCTPTSKLDIDAGGFTDGFLVQQWWANSLSGGVQEYRLKLKQVVTASNIRWVFDQVNAGVSYPNVLAFAKGNIGIGMTDPIQGRVCVLGPNTYPPGTADSQSTAALALIGTTVNTRLLFGLGDAAHGYASWIQSAYDNFGGGNGLEPLYLQPLGGGVGISLGATDTSVSALAVGGSYANPSLSAYSGILDFRVAGGGPQLGAGVMTTTPYGVWLQAKHTNNGGASFPILLNPLGGGVGIGLSNPTYALDVVGQSRFQSKATIMGTSGGGLTALDWSAANILLYYSATTNWAGIGADVNGNMWFRTGTSGTPDARVTIGVAGGLGIGVNPLSYTLQLATDSAGKPGTNTWAVISDARTKRNVRPFREGLATLLRLRPTSYEYNGEAGTPDGLAGVGLVAQEAASVIPACVRWIRGKIAGEETDVMSLNTGDLAFMFLNALRELDARIRQLEGAHA